MTEFRIFETAEFERSLKRLDVPTRDRLRDTIARRVYPKLREQPFAGPLIKKLRDYSPATWRIRLGDFRLFYTIDASAGVVSILAVERRRDAYR